MRKSCKNCPPPTITSGVEYCTGSPVITGTGVPNSKVTLRVGGQSVTAPVDENGNWEISIGPLLPDDYCMLVISRCQYDFTVTTVPLIISPANFVSIDMPPLDQTLAVISGSALPSATVAVDISYTGGLQKIQTTANAAGEWSSPLATAVIDGEVTVTAVASHPPCPAATEQISFTLTPAEFFLTVTDLEMGETFRTVNATFTSLADARLAGPGTVYYVLQKPGLPALDAAAVISYSDAASLADGIAARGSFPLNFETTLQEEQRTLPGRETATPYPDETGVVDGYRYELYMAAVLSGRTSQVTVSPTNALGMPFDHGNGSSVPFGLRELTEQELAAWPDLLPGHQINRAGVTETARMLDNIEGMLVLYEQSGGLYGLADTLSDSYVLMSDFNLSGYADAYNGTGWRPVGTGNGHTFSGKLHSDQSRYLITGLPIFISSTDNGNVLYHGLFGYAADAGISGFDISGASIHIDTITRHSYAGVLAGRFTGSLAAMQISDSTITVTGGAAADLYTGGVIGIAYGNLDLDDLHADNMTILVESTGAGIDSNVNTNTGGLLGGAYAPDALDGITIKNSTVTGSISGISFVGGLVGNVNGSVTEDAANAVISDCIVQADIKGLLYAGGLAGNMNTVIIKNCNVTGGSISDISSSPILTRPFGGLLGALNNGRVYSSFASVDVLIPLGSRAGGLIGDLTVVNPGFSCEITDSGASGNVTAISYSGGLIGGYSTGTDTVTIKNCYATGNVTGIDTDNATSIGGFIGSGQLADYLNCHASGDVTGRSNVGGFIGDSNDTARFIACSASGNIIAFASSSGGFAGQVTHASLQSSYCTGDVSNSANNAGGFISNFTAASTAEDCYAVGNCTGKGNVSGFVQTITQGSSVTRCYAAGTVNATAAAGGVVAAGVSGISNPVHSCFALNPFIAAGGTSVIGRVAASFFALTLSNNSALDTLTLTRGGIPFTPTPGAALKDGATVTLAGLQQAMTDAGWQPSVWDFSTIATLGRPVLMANREQTQS